MTTSSQTDCNCKKSVGERDETLSLEQHYLAAWVPRSFTILCHFYRRVVSRLLRKPLVSPLSRVLFSFLCQALQLYRFQILFQIMVCFATQKNGNNKCPTIISMTWDWGRHLLISSLSPAIYLQIGSCFSLSNRWRQWSDLWCLNVVTSRTICSLVNAMGIR